MFRVKPESNVVIFLSTQPMKSVMLSKMCEMARALKGFDLVIWSWVQRERTKDGDSGNRRQDKVPW